MQFELRDSEEPYPVNLTLDPEKLRFRTFSEEEEKLAIVMSTVQGKNGDATKKEQLAQIRDVLPQVKNNEAERLLAKARSRAAKVTEGDGNGDTQ